MRDWLLHKNNKEWRKKNYAMALDKECINHINIINILLLSKYLVSLPLQKWLRVSELKKNI